jgi:hypothetical protein
MADQTSQMNNSGRAHGQSLKDEVRDVKVGCLWEVGRQYFLGRGGVFDDIC